MDIGTAKPGAESQAVVPHHLIDLIDPHERYSAAQFLDDALRAMGEITQRGNIPLLSRRHHALFQDTAGRSFATALPRTDSLRAAIETGAREKGWPAMHAELALLDPASAARIKPTDSQRIQRALEVCYLTDKPMSEILEKPNLFIFLIMQSGSPLSPAIARCCTNASPSGSMKCSSWD